MTSLLRLLLVLVFACVCAQAQGPWFVDGQLGVDAPGRGTAALPWKTIGHALAQAVPGSNGTPSEVFVVGGQVYGASTNGETFPLALRPLVAVRGLPAGAVPWPVLRGAAGDTLAVLDPSVTYPRGNAPLLRDLVLEAGAHGLAMGSSGWARHAAWIEGCQFRGQLVACVALVSRSNQLDDPLLRDCWFESAPYGLRATADATLALCAPQVEACRFRGITDTAIDLREGAHDPFVGQVVAAAVDGSSFDACANGIRVHAPLGVPVPSTVFVRSSRFADIPGEAVSLAQGAAWTAAWTTLQLEQCSILRCGVGAMLALAPGEWGELVVRDTTVADGQTGVRVWTTSTGYNARVRADLRGLTVLRCTTGIALVPREDAVSTLTLRQTRVLECGTGIHCDLYGTALVESSVVARCQVGVRAYAIGAEFHHLTVADNGVGFRVYNGSAMLGIAGFEGSAVRNSVFGGNATDVDPPTLDPGMGMPLVQTLSFFHRCSFQSTNATQNGNLALTDPQLVRPYLKLAAGSPCLDAAVPGPVTALADYEGGARAVARAAGLPAVADLGADEYVPAGSAHPYGTAGFGEWLTTPHLRASGPVPVGGTLQVDLVDARSRLRGAHAWFGLLSAGFRDDPGQLPFDLSAYGLRSSLLWNEFGTALPIVSVGPAGTATLPVTVPNSLLLVGLTCTFQWHCQMPWAEIVSTEGLRVTIGG